MLDHRQLLCHCEVDYTGATLEHTCKGEDWQLVRCLCGAIVGRCQEPPQAAGKSMMTYRLLKYAIRPVSPTSEPIKIPLSAFVVGDMTEFVQAHATYRFVMMDEEDERPRLLIWLFKPNMRIAYTVPTSYAIPKSGSVHAAKVLYKIVSASERTDLKSLLNKYPGFPQAEFLYYPLSVCRRVATSLRESTTAYPESLRTMTGLNVGWLSRA
ncbi:hypothetical protein AX16_005973 [Volvariella volvacea WC 439]|nr:hypothetical protein AX16_005973 [Volvariella volvacea WC 439]